MAWQYWGTYTSLSLFGTDTEAYLLSVDKHQTHQICFLFDKINMTRRS